MTALSERAIFDASIAVGAKSFAVICTRQDGRERIFQRYVRRDEADAVAAQLRRVGCPARVATGDELALERGAP